MSAHATVRVDLGARGYDIQIGAGLLAKAGAFIAPFAPGGRVFIVSDSKEAGPHLPALCESLRAAG
ncbi:MAG: 3-dehydroquinate synthase, partial [Hyphomonadaceae bacterium]